MTITIPHWLLLAVKWGLPLALFLPWPWYRRTGDFDFGPAIFGMMSACACIAWWLALAISAVSR